MATNTRSSLSDPFRLPSQPTIGFNPFHNAHQQKKKTATAIIMLLSGAALHAAKVRNQRESWEPVGHWAQLTHLLFPQSIWLPSHIPLLAPLIQRGRGAVILSFKSQPAFIILQPYFVVTGWRWAGCVNMRAKPPPESSMQNIFPKSRPLGERWFPSAFGWSFFLQKKQIVLGGRI